MTLPFEYAVRWPGLDGDPTRAAMLEQRDRDLEDFLARIVPPDSVDPDEWDLSLYQLRVEKGVANGYAQLDSGVLVPAAQLGTGTPSSATYLRGDRTWAALPVRFDLVFSWGGLVDATDTSPMYATPFAAELVEAVVLAQVGTTTGDLGITAHVGATTYPTDLPAGDTSITVPIGDDHPADTSVWLTLDDEADGLATDVSVTLRFR